MWGFTRRRIQIVLLALIFVAITGVYGQESQSPKSTTGDGTQKKIDPLDQPTELKFWQLDAGLGFQGAAHVFASGNALGALGARVLATDDRSPLSDWRFVFDEPLPIYHRYLDAIKDRRPLPVIRIEKEKPLPEFWARPGGADWGWYMAFNYALRRADEADLAMFQKAAEENKHVVYPQLKATPERYRGKIITVSGKLTVIRREDPPRFVPDNIERIYTGYITGPTMGAPPFAVTFTELPLNVEPSEKLNLDVTFSGYFLSMVTFPPEKGNKTQKEVVSPYLVGKTIVITPPEKKAEPETAYSYYIIVSTVSGLLVVAILVAAMNVWFRRGDRKIQQRLAAVRDKHLPFNIEPAEPEPETSAEKPIAMATPIHENGIKPAGEANGVKPPATPQDG
jgi:hypothetical protein